ncbi:MAG TPA: SurA N-terminal domain-containing protein, partial [Blastocatellia bacterium]|nr:SurA N-terminal domain-containing protein [Blastocatellia bacterium]
MKQTAFTFLVILIALMTGCRAGGQRSPVIATLDAREIHRSEFERFIALKVGELASSDATDGLRSQMLDEYIRRRLVLEEAERAGLSVTDA